MNPGETHILIYDGTWEGFLSAVFDIYEYKFTDYRIVPTYHEQGFVMGREHPVHTQEARASRVFAGLEKKCSADELRQLLYIFLSEHERKEEILIHLVTHVFNEGKFVINHFQHPLMALGTKLVKQVHREKHRMEAFVRFKKLEDGLFFAIIEPDYDVLPVIRRHFQDRYRNQQWVIYDTRRNYGIYYHDDIVDEVVLDENPRQKMLEGSGIAEDEKMYEAAWLTYFHAVNIKARKNNKLHLQHMPRRYWKFLSEKQPFAPKRDGTG